MIIGSNCVGSRMYEQLGVQFDNPFIWSCIPRDEYITLIREWDNLNLWNYRFFNDGHYNCMRVDDKVTALYPHYIQDDKYDKPTRMSGQHGLDIRYNKIQEYIEEKYRTRLERMTSKDVLFLPTQHENPNLNDVESLSMVQNALIENNRKSILACTYQELKGLETPNNRVVILSQDPNKTSTIAVAKEIIKTLNITEI